MKFSAIKWCALVGLTGLILSGSSSHTQTVSSKKTKVMIYPAGGETTGQLQQQGITRIDDYGSYWVAEASDQDLAKLKATHGDRAVTANHLNRIELSTGAIDTRGGEPAVPTRFRQ